MPPTTTLTRVYSTLRTIATWLVIVINAVLAGVGLWFIIRQYGVSTVNTDGLLPTPWETGWAPYMLALLAGVLISSVWAAMGRRSGRQALMICTVIYMLFIYYQSIQFLAVRKEIQGPPIPIMRDILWFVEITFWMLLSYWCLAASFGGNATPRR
jgi:hypothetical protein